MGAHDNNYKPSAPAGFQWGQDIMAGFVIAVINASLHDISNIYNDSNKRDIMTATARQSGAVGPAERATHLSISDDSDYPYNDSKRSKRD
jgi:hypothetical protein